MRHVLHLLTRPPDETVRVVLAEQANLPELTVETVDLAAERVDYDAVVEKIFAADAVTVW